MTNKRPTILRKKLAWLGLLFLLACGAAFLVLHTREPRYNSRPLTSWLQQYTDAWGTDSNQMAEAQNAIRSIGANRSLPILFKLITSKDDSFDKWLVDVSRKAGIRRFAWRNETTCQRYGESGFEALGSNAAPAVDALLKLVDDNNRTSVAITCLQNIGKPAESALCQCLTNHDSSARMFTIPALARVTGDAKIFISRVKGCLKDSDPSVRVAAVEAIGEQYSAPSLAIPILSETLNSTDEFVSELSITAIAKFGTNGAAAFSSLSNLVASGRAAHAPAAMGALVDVSRKKAVPILSNIVVNGDVSLSGPALMYLKSANPKLSAQMTLAELQSQNPERRSQALSVVPTFDLETPGFAEALESLSKDDNPDVANRAYRIIKQMLRDKKRTPSTVSFPEDPKYKGTPLSEWLQIRQNPWTLSSIASEALRKMGTNAIPPLLRRLEYTDPVFGQPNFDVNMAAVSGLTALGELAKPALPRLMELMDSNNPDLAMHAMMATVGTGPDAIPCLIKGMTNQFPTVRNEAANYLTVELISQYPDARPQVVSNLTKLLNAPDQSLRLSATNALRQLDTQSVTQHGSK